jgi:predicted permease
MVAALRGYLAPPHSEARTWAYLPLILMLICASWAAIGFVSAYLLRKEKLLGQILGWAYCIINAVLFAGWCVLLR